MILQLKQLATQLKAARTRKRLTQQALSAKMSLPQSHLSKIEQAEVDMRVTTLIELSRLLDLELMLVPRHLVNAVNSMAGEATAAKQSAYRLDGDE
jgi:HTH-type transcriptional regulator / antitoxin HipB